MILTSKLVVSDLVVTEGKVCRRSADDVAAGMIRFDGQQAGVLNWSLSAPPSGVFRRLPNFSKFETSCVVLALGLLLLLVFRIERARKEGARCNRARIKNGVPHLDRFGPVKVFSEARSAMRSPPTCGTAFLIAVLAVPGKYAGVARRAHPSRSERQRAKLLSRTKQLLHTRRTILRIEIIST